MSKIKNYQKLDKNSIFSNCSYAQSAGVYYNQKGFSNVTNKIQDMGTYNPDKYILGNITNQIRKHLLIMIKITLLIKEIIQKLTLII